MTLLKPYLGEFEFSKLTVTMNIVENNHKILANSTKKYFLKDNTP